MAVSESLALRMVRHWTQKAQQCNKSGGGSAEERSTDLLEGQLLRWLRRRHRIQKQGLRWLRAALGCSRSAPLQAAACEGCAREGCARVSAAAAQRLAAAGEGSAGGAAGVHRYRAASGVGGPTAGVQAAAAEAGQAAARQRLGAQWLLARRGAVGLLTQQSGCQEAGRSCEMAVNVEGCA